MSKLIISHEKRKNKSFLLLALGILFFTLLHEKEINAQDFYLPSKTTKVILLGTGTPNPDPERSGPAIAIVVNETPYIIDCGPGIVRQAAAVSTTYGGNIKGLETVNLKLLFITHLHTDHTAGYPDLIFTPWVMGRDEPLEVYGPEGIKSMTEHILLAYQEDIKVRLYGLEPANNQGWRVNAHEINPGIIYKDENVTVEAFLVNHGNWPESYGFKFTTPDRTIVISGDTSPCENLIKYSKGVDILIHEVYSQQALEKRNKFWQTYHSKFHTSSYELARIAAEVQPGILILYHQLFWNSTEDDLLKEIKERYKGKVVSAKDLDVF